MARERSTNWYGKTSELAVQAVYTGTGGKGGRNGGKGPSWSVQKYFNSGKGEKGASRAGKGKWSKIGGKKGGKGQEKGSKGDTRVCRSCVKAVEEDKEDISEEGHEDEDELHAWCLLEESENEQWQEVTSKKSKLKTKKFAHESLLSVDNNSCASPRKVIEVKDNGVSIRATMYTGAAGYVMLAETFPASETGSHEHNKEIRCRKWRKNQRLG